MILDGKVVIVTGATGDVGLGVCRALERAGAIVVGLDIDTARAAELDHFQLCDVTQPAACRSAVEGAVDRFGGVDALVNLAQYMGPQLPLLQITDDELSLRLDSGPRATLRMMQLCHPHFLARGAGAIINFASGAGTSGMPELGSYAAAKEAIRGLTKVAAMEWGRENITANAICPVAATDVSRLGGAAVEAIMPMGRIGDPETDIGAVVVFLAGPGARFITGRTIQVDGGAGYWI
jgi:NAD(P)-dependent dehydrogenase (short-subunit alcohol dehydrogenase family)